MSKSIPFYLDDELEDIIKTILENTDDFETEQSCIRIACKKYFKTHYRELLLKRFKDE